MPSEPGRILIEGQEDVVIRDSRRVILQDSAQIVVMACNDVKLHFSGVEEWTNNRFVPGGTGNTFGEDALVPSTIKVTLGPNETQLLADLWGIRPGYLEREVVDSVALSNLLLIGFAVLRDEQVRITSSGRRAYDNARAEAGVSS